MQQSEVDCSPLTARTALHSFGRNEVALGGSGQWIGAITTVP